jgi:hypothetical protein
MNARMRLAQVLTLSVAALGACGESPRSSPYSIDFIVENDSQQPKYLAYVGLGDYHLSLEVSWQGQPIDWYGPECAANASCGFPVDTVRKLVPGERVTLPWDGVRHSGDRIDPVGEGSGRAHICTYEAFECLPGNSYGCPTEAALRIRGAIGSGTPACVEAPFAFPADSGGSVVLTLQ